MGHLPSLEDEINAHLLLIIIGLAGIHIFRQHVKEISLTFLIFFFQVDPGTNKKEEEYTNNRKETLLL